MKLIAPSPEASADGSLNLLGLTWRAFIGVLFEPQVLAARTVYNRLTVYRQRSDKLPTS